MRPSDGRPACPTCGTDVFVDLANSNHDDYVCRACAGRFDADEVTL
jgi:DNA-directed RNA polymerase subunit RPC12/RpoP